LQQVVHKLEHARDFSSDFLVKCIIVKRWPLAGTIKCLLIRIYSVESISQGRANFKKVISF
jgi:hypothetical protein